MTAARAARTVLLAGLAAAFALLAATIAAGPLTWSAARLDVAGHPTTLGVTVDPATALLLALVTGVGALVAAFSVRYLAGERSQTRFAWLLVATVAATAAAVVAPSLPLLALAWLAAGLLVAAVVGVRGDAEGVRAARRVRRVFLAGDLALVAAVLVLVAAAPAGASLDRADLPALVAGLPAGVLLAVTALAAVAGLVRSAQWPVHRWLPETAAAATPVSALLHAGVVNGAGVLAVLLWPLYAAASPVLVVVATIGLATAAMSGAVMRGRADVKGRLAASTSAQMGYLSLQVGLGLPGAALLHALGHGAYKASLFLGSGDAVGRLLHERYRPAPVPASRRSVLAWGASASVAGIAIAAVAAAWLPPVHAPASWLLVAAATVTAVVLATRGATADAAVPQARRARWAALPLLGLAGYLVAVGWLERVVLDSLAASSLSAGVQWLVAGVAVLVAVTALVIDRAVLAGRSPRLRAWSVRSALPPRAWRPRVGSLGPLDAPAVPAASRARARVMAGHAAATVVTTWPLDSFVATNPLGGLDHLTPAEALARLAAVRGTRSHLDQEIRRRWWREGRVSPDALVASRERDRAVAVGEQHHDARTAADLIDDLLGTSLVRRADDEAAVWCAACYDRGEAPWGAPVGDGLWATWRRLGTGAGADRALGVPGAGAWLAALPERVDEALVAVLAAAGYPEQRWPAVLERTANRLPGWLSHARWRAEQGGDDVVELLTVRLAVEVVLVSAACAPGGVAHAQRGQVSAFVSQDATEAATAISVDDLEALVWQEALEESRRRPLLDAVAAATVTETETPQAPDAQVVLCIDVRSERLRRHLEQVGAGRWETLGFAGFFGVPFHHVPFGAAGGSDQCPVLLRPRNLLTERPVDGAQQAAAAALLARRGSHAAGDAIHATADHPVSPFVWAEVAGYGMGVASALRTAAPRWWAGRKRRHDAPVRLVVDGGEGGEGVVGGDAEEPGEPSGFTVTEQVFLAEAALRTMGLVAGFARVVVLTGHGATTTNNPFDTGYDCGACGGNAGSVNARALAAMLADARVRDGLRERGIDVPATTVFLSALHDTTVDSVEIDEPARPVDDVAGTLLADLRRDLAVARGRVALQRTADLPGAPAAARRDPSRALAHVERRAADWSEVRPEWGLVGNYAFVAGPRRWTRGVDLDGRVFLHSYDPAADPDSAALEVILTAPVVVAQWINAQYLATAIDPDGFGSGSKVVHNVVGRLGVVAGARGDLRPALPLQAIADGTDALRHEPLRLMVVVHARPDEVDAVVARHDLLQRLLGNGWITLVTVSPDDDRLRRWAGTGRWVDEPSAAPADPATAAGERSATGGPVPAESAADPLPMGRAVGA